MIVLNRAAYSSETLTLVIAPTTACNFACPYCFEPKQRTKTINDDVIEKLLEYLKSMEGLKKLYITWYGGEPLLALDAAKKIYNKIKSETELEMPYSQMVTNGYLINQDAIDFFKESGLKSIQITLDGPESHHNSTRYLKHNRAENTFAKIVSNIESLAKSMPELHISVRVNVNKNNPLDYVEIYRMFEGEDWHKNIGVYPGIIREDADDKINLCETCYSRAELLGLYEIYKEYGIPVNFLPSLSHKGCMMQRDNAIILGPEGEIYKCWNDVGDDSKVVFDISQLGKQNGNLYLRYMCHCGPLGDECKDCYVFPICDGGCGLLRYRNNYENCKFIYCTPLKEPAKLERALLLSLEHSVDGLSKYLNL